MSAHEIALSQAISEVGMRENAELLMYEFRRPYPRLIEHALLAYPEAFGERFRRHFVGARECVLRDGDAESRERILSAKPVERAEAEVARVRRMLEGRPSDAERAAPALVYAGSSVVIALAHPLPHGSDGLFARMQLALHPETVTVCATRIDATPDLLLRWAAIGHDSPPNSVWECSPPSWFDGVHRLAIELTPNPRGFHEAILVAHRGAGRVLVPQFDPDAPSHEVAWRRTSVMPSGWSYLRGDRTMGSSRPVFPNGAPRPVDGVRVPDDFHFAMCAALTWTLSLQDAMWLRDALDRLATATNQEPTQGDDTP